MAAKNAYHHGSLRTALIENALASLQESSYENLSLRKLATRIGVNQTALYSHFKNKNALLAELAKHGFSILINESNAILKEHAEPEKSLSLFASYYIQFARQNQELFKLMFGPTFTHLHPENAELWRIAEQSFSLFQTLIEQYQRSINSPVPCKVAVLTIWSFMHGFGYLIIGDRLGEESLGALENHQLLEQMLTIIKRGLHSPNAL